MADPWDYLLLDGTAEQAARRSRAKYAKRVPLDREELRGEGPAIPEGLLKRVVSAATGISERKVGDIGQFVKDVGYGVATLPQRMLQASEAQRQGYGFDPQTVTEAAGTAVGLPGIAAARRAMGFGKVRPPVADPVLAATSSAEQARGLRTPIAGLPDKVLELEPGVHFKPGPIESVHRLAEQYMAGKGMRYEPKKTYLNVDPERAGRIAQAFEEMPHAPHDPKVRASYDAMINETVDQFRQLENAGVKFEFIKPGQADPYAASPRLAQKDFIENKHLWVFPTDVGFGSTGSSAAAAMSDNPLLRPTGVKIEGRDLPANDLFRIVHDVFGHFKEGTGFRAGGEENAWRSHAAMYSPEALPAMTTETRGQNSWLNYGPHGATNRTAKSADTVFADQKTGLLPEWAMKEGFDETGYALGSGARDQSGRGAVVATMQGGRPSAIEPGLPRAPTDIDPSRKVSLGQLYRGVEGGTDREAALRAFKGGDLGDATYFTGERKLAESYGGGPGASVKAGTRAVHEYRAKGELFPEEVAYVFGGAKRGEDVRIVSGNGIELYNGPWGGAQMEQALKGHEGLKAVVGTEGSIGRGQIGVRDPSIIDRAIEPPLPKGKIGAPTIVKQPEIADPKLRAKAEKVTGAFPQYGEAYPAAGPPVLKDEATMKPVLNRGRPIMGDAPTKQAASQVEQGLAYWGKELTPEAREFQKALETVRRDMEVNPWDPYFDISKRADVDPKDYPTPYDMARDADPKKPETIATWNKAYGTPEARERLQRGYFMGQGIPNATDWYLMKQLEQEYIRELGPAAGRKRFRDEFAGSMAATTGGASPTANFQMGHYADVMRHKGQEIPRDSHQLPFPIGGRYAAKNLEQYRKFRERPDLTYDPQNPKRHDFMNAFLGHKTATVDEQMMGAIVPGVQQPEWYSPATRTLIEEAGKVGVDPRAFQDVTWAGLKKIKTEGKGKPFDYEGPMMQHLNMSVERTSRLTGLSPDEVVRLGLILKRLPMYGVGGLMAGGVAAGAMEPQLPR